MSNIVQDLAKDANKNQGSRGLEIRRLELESASGTRAAEASPLHCAAFLR